MKMKRKKKKKKKNCNELKIGRRVIGFKVYDVKFITQTNGVWSAFFAEDIKTWLAWVAVFIMIDLLSLFHKI